MTEALFRDDAYLRETSASVAACCDAGVVLDRTVFYPTGGGQPGDTGVLERADGSTIAVVDTRKGDGDAIVHVLADDAPRPDVGESLTARIDWERRLRHMRMHTCLHLLGAVLPYGVTGGSIGAQRSRLDFDMQETVDKAAVEAGINALIDGNHEVRTRWITDEELDAQPELIRTMSVKPPRGVGRVRLLEIVDVDLQPCGGTHVRRTGEIGRIRVGKVEKKGKRNRRVNILFDED